MKAIKTFNECHIEKRPANVPLNYIWIFQETELEELEGFAVITNEAFNLLIAEQDAWFAANAPVEVPEEITPRQARQALFLNGVTEQMIESAILSLTSPTKEMAMIEWKHSIAFKRNNPLVSTMASMLGWTSAQLDALWIQGSQL